MNALTITNDTSIIRNFDDAERAAKAMAGSGFFTDAKQASQAIVKIMAGHEMGFGPFASMVGVSIIQGKPAVGANLQAAAIKRTGKYDFRVAELTNDVCDLTFFQGGQEIGHSRFTMDDAKAAGLAVKDNWKKWPRNMLFARAISNGAKWFAPDAFNGATVYTPDELGAAEDGDGNIIEGSYTKSEPAAEVKTPQPTMPSTNGKTSRPLDPETLRDMLRRKATGYAERAASPEQRGLAVGMLGLCFAGDSASDAKSRSVTTYLFEHTSRSELTDAEILALLDLLKPTKDTGGAYAPDAMGAREIRATELAHLLDAGQAELMFEAAEEQPF